MCDQELHRGKYVCVHDVPWALDTASATTENPGFFDANVSTENPGLFDTNHPVFHGVCLVVPLLNSNVGSNVSSNGRLSHYHAQLTLSLV